MASLPTSAAAFWDHLASALPGKSSFRVHHLSTPPSKCDAIFMPQCGTQPQKTYCEKHFLALSIHEPALLIFAIEVLVYTTESLTTLFVSKADSTGYLHLLEIPADSPSPLKTVTSVFLSHLVKCRKRKGVKLTISLFARAQDQYLFPGSSENRGKHVLDDRGLIKWWGKILDSILREYPGNVDHITSPLSASSAGHNFSDEITAEGYLIVPGFDKYETMQLYPPIAKSEPLEKRRWINGHPLRTIAPYPEAPPRCLVPHFPDDPKARFLDDLEDEVSQALDAPITNPLTPSKRPRRGEWRSVRTIEQFWDTLAYRQECSAGRIVGFLWLVFAPRKLAQPTHKNSSQTSSLEKLQSINNSQQAELGKATSLGSSIKGDATQHSSLPSSMPQSKVSLASSCQTTKTRMKSRAPKLLTGPITPRSPRIKRCAPNKSDQPSRTTVHYHWPADGRGEIILNDKEYQRAFDLLLRLDFANERLAQTNSKKWLDEVALIAGINNVNIAWGKVVFGTHNLDSEEDYLTAGSPNSILSVGNSARGKREGDESHGKERVNIRSSMNMPTHGLAQSDLKRECFVSSLNMEMSYKSIKTLPAGLIRKKAKVSPQS
ncbi:MAG: hypothetical protein M1829_000647 [Trizodia sp. TS-e1964]|nr:MAG: hypothetical protein M1829_000647 [Trizodia sp. TS-e1964]